MSKAVEKHPVGSIRPSQLLWTYGPGALIDLPNLSVITMGLNHWDPYLCRVIDEARLLEAVRQKLGPQVQHLREPPVILDEDADPLTAEARQGVPVRPFPRWLRCVRCGLLAEYDSGLFEIKADRFRPERTHFVHATCEKGGSSDAVPARFLLACRNGHLDDFPWHWFVHGGSSDCKGTLRFFERGASLQTENLWVKCDACGSAKSLAQAFGELGQKNLPACRGRHPHLGDRFEHCDERPRPVLLGAANSWFPVTLSVLAIPVGANPLEQLINDAWEELQGVKSRDELKGVLKVLKKRPGFGVFDQYSLEEVLEAVERRQGDPTEIASSTETDLKRPEWNVLTSPNPPSDWPHFLCEPTEVPAPLRRVIRSVSLIKRLREVNALIGFTRVESPDEGGASVDGPQMGTLSQGRPEWVPATEVFGEGIFIRFEEEAVRAWEASAPVQSRHAKLLHGHRGWRNRRKLDPERDYPGIRYAMLHTFAHVLIRELALECGYSSASIRERIYASDDESAPMAGVLLYTAAADSDGTLGGLIELGKPEHLGPIVQQALQRARVCSSDPLCSEHDPAADQSVHLACCHACGFLSETSCERSNQYLDRALIVPTFECSDAAFFGQE